MGTGDLIEGDALGALENKLKITIENNLKNMPFVGGFLGVFNYDLIKTYENIPQENKALFNTKNILGLYVKTFYVSDKKSGTRKIYSINESTKKGENNAFKAIKNLTKDLSQQRKKKEIIKRKHKFIVKSNTTQRDFVNKVKKAKEYIKNGDIFQVVLSQRFEVSLNEEPSELLEKIEHEESTFKYYFNFEKIHILGLSPEILVKKQGNKITTNPIAGTRKRGLSKVEEAFLEKDLLNDSKEKAEHTMLVDLARNDMGKIAEIGSVKVKNFMQIKKYKKVMHLTSQVLGNSHKDNLEILKTFLPAGTLTGAPKIRAMEIIESLEEEKREIYGGCIGYLSFNENLETAITIRSMVVKNKKAYIQAGAGIVYDSKPEREYEETREKASQLIDLIKEGTNDSINR
jgi:anthranilate synthase component 1